MAPRRYESPVREARATATRARILDVAFALLAEQGLDAVTIPAVARAAGVSVPTVYRHFPTPDDLMRGFLAAIRPRIGQTVERLYASVDELERVAAENYAGYEQHARTLLPLMESREFNRVRVSSVGRRAALGAKVVRPRAPRWSERELEGASAAVYAFISPQVWRWMKETWGLDADVAARSATWAIRTLLEAIAQGRGLDAPRRRRGTAHDRK